MICCHKKSIYIPKQPPEMFFKKVTLTNFAKFTGKHLCRSLYFNKIAGQKPATLLKKRLRWRRFPVNFAKLLTTTFLRNTSRDCFCVSVYPKFFSISNDFIQISNSKYKPVQMRICKLCMFS